MRLQIKQKSKIAHQGPQYHINIRKEFHDELFAKAFLLSENKVKNIADDLDLDTEVFDNCFDSQEKATKVNADYQAGIQSGVRGTPSFMVGNQLLRGAQPFEVFQRVIEGQLS